MFLILEIILEILQTAVNSETRGGKYLSGWHVVFERIRLRRSDAGTELVEKTDSEGNRLSCFADSKLERNVPPGELGADADEAMNSKCHEVVGILGGTVAAGRLLHLCACTAYRQL